jgi:lipoyl(octanoyl) transferase
MGHRLMFNSVPAIWDVSQGLTSYIPAVERMEQLAGEIHQAKQPEHIWLVEHPPLFTAGTSAKSSDLVAPDRFPVHQSGRGGQYTYHGPGQRVAYVMLDLNRRTPDVRLFVSTLEQWIINTLDQFNIRGERRQDRVGVWVERPDKAPLPDGQMREDKIAAIGIRIRKWVTFHGISINLEPDLEHFSGIVPCGIAGGPDGHGVTSLVDLGLPVTMDDLDQVLQVEYRKLFG